MLLGVQRMPTKSVIFCILLHSIVIGTSPAVADSFPFDSYEPGDHQKIFAGSWKSNKISARADMTMATRADAPLVVYNPGWGGIDKYLPAFKDIQSKLGNEYHHIFLSHSDDVDLAGRTITIYQAIRAAKSKGITPNKILLVGASGGGQEAIHSTHSITATALSDGIDIDGVVAFYPSCRVGFEDKTWNKTSVRIFTGGKDKVAPAGLCKRLKQSGGLSHAELIDYPEAGHSWLMVENEKTRKQRTWGDCQINIDKSGVWQGKNIDSRGGIGNFLRGMGKKCGGKINMVVGRNKNAYRESIASTVDFVKSITN